MFDLSHRPAPYRAGSALAFTGVGRIALKGTAGFFDLAPHADALVVHGCWAAVQHKLLARRAAPARRGVSYRIPFGGPSRSYANPRAGNPAPGYPYQVHRRHGICRRRRLRDIDGLPLTASRSIVIDLNTLLRRHQLSLMVADRSMTPREKRAHEQFAREISDQIARTRAALGVGRALPGSVT